MICHYSVRRVPAREAINKIAPIYDALIKAEKRGGMNESLKLWIQL